MALSTQDCSLTLTGSTARLRQAVARSLAQKLGQSIFEMWFADGRSILVEQQSITFLGDSQFTVTRLAKKFGKDIEEAVLHSCGPNFKIQYQVQAEAAPAASEDVQGADSQNSETQNSDTQKASKNIPQELSESGDEPDGCASPTDANEEPNQMIVLFGGANQAVSDQAARRKPGLESFWFGETNRLAEVGTRQMFQQLGQLSPFFVYGPTGCGKSHLLESIAVDARRRLRLKRCVYMSAEQFTIYFIQALRGTGLPTFRRKYRDLDLLAIDDIQFFEGKKATLGEFQYTIDNLTRAGKQIILASDRPPIELNHFGAELVARLTVGLICPLQYPDQQGREKILRRMCRQRQFSMPSDVIELIAGHLGRDVRRLSGGINRVHAMAQATGEKITVEMASQVLADLFSVTSSNTSLVTIEKAVCEFCGVKPSELKSSSRRKRISTARMLAMYLSRQYTSSAFSEIGDYFGGRSHSTVIAAQKKVTGWIDENRAIDLPNAMYPAKEAVTRLESNLRIG